MPNRGRRRSDELQVDCPRRRLAVRLSASRRCRTSVLKGVFASIAIWLNCPTASLHAWGDLGHEIIGIIALARLTPAAKQQIDALLAADRDNLTAPDFVSRTTWADKYRDSDRQTNRIRYITTRNWHFVDIELADGDLDAACKHHPKLPLGTAASTGPAETCLVDKIDQFINELRRSVTAKPEKILALKFLLHLIGDLHQPLHAANNHDRGGNDISVLVGDDRKPANLHSYWDNQLVQQLGDAPKIVGTSLEKRISESKAAAWSKGSTAAWAMESFRQAKSSAYDLTGVEPFIDGHGAESLRLNAAYDQRSLPAVREQLSKAGVRLAAVLNKIFK